MCRKWWREKCFVEMVRQNGINQNFCNRTRNSSIHVNAEKTLWLLSTNYLVICQQLFVNKYHRMLLIISIHVSLNFYYMLQHYIFNPPAFERWDVVLWRGNIIALIAQCKWGQRVGDERKYWLFPGRVLHRFMNIDLLRGVKSPGFKQSKDESCGVWHLQRGTRGRGWGPARLRGFTYHFSS